MASAAQVNRQGLLKLAAAIQEHPVVISSAGFDALVEYDRRRLTREMLLEKVVATLAATMQAEILLGTVEGATETQQAVETIDPQSSEESEGKEATKRETMGTIGGPRTSAMMALLIYGDAAGVRKE